MTRQRELLDIALVYRFFISMPSVFTTEYEMNWVLYTDVI